MPAGEPGDARDQCGHRGSWPPGAAGPVTGTRVRTRPQGRQQHVVGAARPREIGLRGCSAPRPGVGRPPRRAAAASRSVSTRGQAFGQRVGRRLDQHRGLGREHLRVGAEIGGDDRPPRAQIRVDLERRIGAGDARRHQDVARLDEMRHLGRRSLPREDQRRAGLAGPRRQLRDLLGRAAHHQHGDVGHARLEPDARVEQQVQPLVLLERPGVEHHRLRRRQAPGRADGVATRPGRRVDVAAHDVLDQHGAVADAHLVHRVLQFLADRDDHLRAAHHVALGLLEPPAQRPRTREAEVPELLRQARVHVVQVRNAEAAPEPDAEHAHLLVRVDGVVARAAEATPPGGSSGSAGRRAASFTSDGPIGTDAHEGRPPGPDDAEVRQVDVAADRVGDQVDVVAVLDQGLDAVVLAERACRAARRTAPARASGS